MEEISLYLHIPFCKHRCGYCDFNTYAGLDNLIPNYVDALIKELQAVRAGVDEQIGLKSIFFGGGTPSLLPINSFEKIFDVINEKFSVKENAELTIEVNPGTVNFEYFKGLKQLGVNRISMGVQSASESDLKVLERQHGYADAVVAVEAGRKAGFENISMDLIFGVPYQSMEAWQRTVNLALDLDPQHLSLYALTVEHGTPLEKLVIEGVVTPPDSDLAADMYEWAEEFLADKGFEHYEISNWARRDDLGELLSSKHNLQYWLNEPYIGVGAGAHGFIAQHRTMNVLSPSAYIERHEKYESKEFPRTPATISAKLIDQAEEIKETMMMGLRLLEEGVSKDRFFSRFGKQLGEVYETEIAGLSRKGLLEWRGGDNQNLVLTEKGRLLGNQVFVEFI